jgi:Tol biopolymer transport system component
MRSSRRLAAALGLCSVLTAAAAQAADPERHATLPAVSPDGRQVAYIREYAPDSVSLRVMRIDGSHDLALTTAGKLDGVPGWTRDGKHVLLSVT